MSNRLFKSSSVSAVESMSQHNAPCQGREGSADRPRDSLSPSLVLRPYQETGVAWLCDTSPYKLLADDMGLGKTPQTIAAITRLGFRTGVVVCPATVKIMWARRLSRWGVTLGNIFVVPNGKAALPATADVIIINYDLVIRPEIKKQLIARGKSLGYDFVIFDESRALKEMTAKRTKACLGKGAFTHYAKRIWLLDGTPVPNRPVELYPVLSTLAPEVIDPYSSYHAFGEYFCKGRRNIFGWDMSGHSHISELSDRLTKSGFFLRRTKEEVMDDLPEKVETFIEIDVSCPSSTADTHIATVRRDLAIAKMPHAIRYILDVVAECGKCVVFAYHRDVVEGLQAGLESINAVKLYGGMTMDEKQTSIDNFIQDDSVGALVGQIIAGGSGVDGLQEVCCNVVFVELDWSPGAMDQAIDRMIRIGQKSRTVFIHYLAVPNSNDTVMTDVLDRKRAVITKLMAPGGVVPVDARVSCTVNAGKEKDIEMTMENELKRIADALEELVKQGGGTGTSSAARGRGGKKEPVAVDPPVALGTTAAPAAGPTQSGEAAPTKEDALAAVAKFLAGATSPEQKAEWKELIRTKILPQVNAPSLKELPADKYPAFIALLEPGVSAYLQAAPAGMDDDFDV